MKASYAALGIVCLALGGLWYVGGGSNISSQAAADELHVSAPIAHENLTVFFIHGPDTVLNAQIMTLQEAIESGRAIVHETGNVHELAVENLSSDYELFMQEGDIIRGGQQDRLIACDMLVPPRSGRVPFPCNCVEHGRWTGRGNEAATHFNKSDRFAVGQNLKIANIHRQQGEVWNSVEQQKKVISEATKVNVNSAISPSSLQLALENPAVKEKAAEYESTLKTEGETRQNVIGVVFLVNGEVSGVELYGSNALFRKAWPKLLRSAATEALAEKSEKPLQAPPSARDMERYLARVGKMELPASSGFSNLARVDQGMIIGHLSEEGLLMGRASDLLEAHAIHDALLQPPIPPAQQPTQQIRRVIIEGSEVTGDRVISNQLNPRPGQPGATSNAPYQPQPQPATSPGAGVAQPQPFANQPASRLSVNRVENSSGVVSESRDPMRQDALIHKSFIKK